MSPAAHRVAVVGGNRIPFARSDGAYAQRVQPGHAHRGARRARRPLRPGGRAAGRGRRGRGAQAQPRLQPHARVRARRAPGRPRRPPTTSSRRAAPGLEAVVLVANKIALGQIEAGIAGGVDTTSDAPHRAQRGPARRPARRATARGPPATGCGRSPGCARGRSSPRSRATRSRARGCRWASTRRSPPREWGITRDGAGRAGRRAATSGSRPPTSAASTTASSPRTSASSATRTCGPDSSAEKLGQAQAGLRRRATAR